MGKLAEIYGSSDCYFCAQALRLCELEHSIQVKFYDTDDAVNYVELERRLCKEVRFTPHVFIDGEHLEGGYIELRCLLRLR